MIQVLHLFGTLPNMLELTVNPCTQGCEYCYAKNWKKELYSVDRVINDILRKEQKREGLVPWLIRQRSAISISNRSDILTTPNWREYLAALKKLGFPIYLETKLTPEYKDLADILDTSKDYIYQTITGYNDRYEEHNLLSPEEKIQAAKWLKKKGFKTCLAVNPYMPDKVTVPEIQKMIQEVKPAHFVMRPYHTGGKGVEKKLFRPLYPKEETESGLNAMREYCRKKNQIYDINGEQDFLIQRPDLSRRKDCNNFLFGGNHFVFQDFIEYIYSQFDEETDGLEITFDSFIDFYSKQIDYFSSCIFTRNCYRQRWVYFDELPVQFGIMDFLKHMWNKHRLLPFDWYSDEVDKDGNLIHVRRGDECK